MASGHRGQRGVSDGPSLLTQGHTSRSGCWLRVLFLLALQVDIPETRALRSVSPLPLLAVLSRAQEAGPGVCRVGASDPWGQGPLSRDDCPSAPRRQGLLSETAVTPCGFFLP